MAKTKAKTRPWDAAEHMETEEDMAAYFGSGSRRRRHCTGGSYLGGHCPRPRNVSNRPRNRPGAGESL